MFLKYIIKIIIKSIISTEYRKSSEVIRNYNFYKSAQCDKKSTLVLFKEIRYLYKYWNNVWPDSYFRFGMFRKDYGNMEKMKSFIPQEAYAKKISHHKFKYNILIDDKILCHDLLSFYNIPVPERLFVLRDNIFRLKEKILEEDDVNQIIKSSVDNRIFVKKISGGGGSGISVISKNSFQTNCFEFTANDIRKKYWNESIIFERPILQHSEISRFNPDSVNTIRILTYNNEIIASTIRFGGKGDFVDNISKGGLAVNIDLETGKLGEYGTRIYDYAKHYEHPDSHLKFKDTFIPQWKEIKDLVKKCMEYLPYYSSVGFDIALSENGPIIIEINTGAGIGLSQIGMDKGLAEIFK